MRTKELLLVVAGIGFVSCTGSVNDDPLTCEPDIAAECDNELDEWWPEGTAYYKGTIEIEFDDQEDGVVLKCVDTDGNAVSGNTSWRDDTLVFSPSADLAPSTEYKCSVVWSCGLDCYSVSTSDVGGEVDPGSLVGRSYALDLAPGSSTRFLEPPGVGGLLQQYLTTDVLVGVVAADASTVQMIGAVGKEGAAVPEQDTCNPSIPFPEANFTNAPYFQVGPGTAAFSVEGYEIAIDGFELSGAFSPDGSRIEGAVLSGTIDTRPFAGLVAEDGEEPTEDAVCELAFAIGVLCEPCPDGTGDFCLSLVADSITATALSGSLEEIDDPCAREECSADPDCQTE